MARTRILSRKTLKAILRRAGVDTTKLEQSISLYSSLANLSEKIMDLNKYQPDKGLEFLEDLDKLITQLEEQGCKVVYMAADKKGILHIFYQCSDSK